MSVGGEHVVASSRSSSIAPPFPPHIVPAQELADDDVPASVLSLMPVPIILGFLGAAICWSRRRQQRRGDKRLGLHRRVAGEDMDAEDDDHHIEIPADGMPHAPEDDLKGGTPKLEQLSSAQTACDPIVAAIDGIGAALQDSSTANETTEMPAISNDSRAKVPPPAAKAVTFSIRSAAQPPQSEATSTSTTTITAAPIPALSHPPAPSSDPIPLLAKAPPKRAVRFHLPPAPSQAAASVSKQLVASDDEQGASAESQQPPASCLPAPAHHGVQPLTRGDLLMDD